MKAKQILAVFLTAVMVATSTGSGAMPVMAAETEQEAFEETEETTDEAGPADLNEEQESEEPAAETDTGLAEEEQTADTEDGTESEEG